MTDRLVTIPNALSLLRLLGVPVFLWLVVDQRAPVAGFVLLVVAGITDWLDGFLARRLHQMSRVGALLDPLVDRLYIAATLIGLALTAVISWWLVGLLIAREVMLLALVPMLRRQGRLALPVTKVGKAATFALMWGFPLLLLGSVEGVVGDVLTMAGWACALWGTWLYWWAGFDYVRQATQRPSGAAGPK